MEEEEFNKLVSKVGEQSKTAIKTEVAEAAKGLVTADQLEEKLKAAGLEDGAINTLTEAVEKQGEEMRKLFEEKDSQNGKSVSEMIAEKAEDIKNIATGKIKGVDLSISQKAQVTRAGVSDTTMAMRLPEVGQLPYLGTVMSGLFRHAQVSPSSNGTIRYIDQDAITRGAASVAEAATKPESAITWIERTLQLEKIADSIPVTKEAFADVQFIESEIQRLLNTNLALKEDQQLWNGTGTTPQMKGVFTTALAFDAAAYALSSKPKVIEGTIYDLLAILRVEIMNGKQSAYMPNVAVLNPSDILRYKLAKASDGHYVLPPFIDQNGQVIDGMRVVESSQVTVNTLVVGDFNRGTIYDLENVEISMGYVNDQFVKNAMTILAEKRAGLLIRNVEADGFIKVTDIDASITAITV